MTVDIPAQSAQAAVRRLVELSGVQIVYEAELLRRITSRAVNGRLTPREALERMFADSDIRVLEAGPDVLTLQARPKAQLESQVITVTASAQKFDVPASKAPQALAEVDRDTLDQRGVQSVEEAVRYLPFVQAKLSRGRGFDDFTIRGFSGAAYQFKDGLRLDPNYLQQQEPWGLERVEVLRGPASVLYGQISPGGVLNMVSKRPQAEPLLQGGVTLGSHGLKSAYLDAGGALDAERRWTARLPVLVRDQDDTQDFVTARRSFAAPAISWRPNKDVLLTVYGVFQEDRYRRLLPLPLQGTLLDSAAGPVPRDLSIGEPGLPQFEVPQVQLGFEAAWRLSEAWQLQHKLRKLDYSLQGAVIQAPRAGSTDISITRRGFDYRNDTEAVSSDTQLRGQFGGSAWRSLAILGFDTQRYRQSQRGQLFSLPALNPYAPVYGSTGGPRSPFFDSKARLDQEGLYVQGRLQAGERWIVQLGSRHSRSRSADLDLLTSTESPRSDRKTTSSAGLMYLAPQGLSPYLSYAESFEPQFFPLVSGGNAPPSLGKQIEAGFKWRDGSGRLEGELAVFDLRNTDIPNGDPNNPGFFVIVGEQRHRGIEAVSRWAVLDGLQLSLAYAYLDAKITRSLDGREGQRPPLVPRHAGSVELKLEGHAIGQPALGATLGARSVSSRRADTIPAVTLPAFTLLDAGLSWNFSPSTTASLIVKNAADKEHWVGGFGRGVVPGEPRTVQLTLRVSR